MPWSAPPYTGGVVWEDAPSENTPLNAADLNTEENAEATYAAQVGQSVANYVDAETARAQTAEALKLAKASNLSDIADVDSSRANLKVPVLRHAQCVSTTNRALSGALPTIDGYVVQDGDRVLLAGQTTASQNGPWIAHVTGWVRPNDYPAGAVLTSRSCKVTGGTIYGATDWLLASTANVTVDTTAATWKQLQPPPSVVSGSSPDAIYMTALDASFASFVARIPANGVGVIPSGMGAISIPSSVSLASQSLRFGAGSYLQKAAAFTDPQALLVSGTVAIDAPVGSVILDGNQVGGAAGNGIATSGAAVLVMQGGVVQNNKSGGVVVASSGADVRCYGTGSSSNVSGTNTAAGFYAASNGKLRTWECIANSNDRSGFFFDRTAAVGCRLDGYAFFNSLYGASIRSYRGHFGQFVADQNIKGGVAIEFGGDSWKGGTVHALNNGVGEEIVATLNTNTTVNVASAEAWWGGQTISDLAGGIPAGTTIVGPVAPGATTITLSQAATATGQTTLAIGNTSGFGVEMWGGSRCEFKVIERNNSGYGCALAAMASPLSTTISNAASPITATQTIIPATSLSAWPSGGVILIGSELIFYQGVSGNSYIGCMRGAYGTTAATHADGATVSQSTAPRSNQIVLDSDALANWDNDPALHMSGGAERNHVKLSAHGRSFAASFGEGFGAANNNVVEIVCDTISNAIIRITNGSNNRFKVKARDCWNSSGSYPALFYFNNSDGGAVTGNIIDADWEHKTINRPAPTATLAEAGGATGNYIATYGPSLERSLWWPAGAVAETCSRDFAPQNQATGLVSGTHYVFGGLVLPEGKTTANGTLFSGTTALTMGSNADGHFQFTLIRVSDGMVLAVSADQGGATTWAATSAKALAWASAYTPDIDTAVYLGLLVILGTGGAPAMPTLEAISLNSTPSTIRSQAPVLAGTWGSGLAAVLTAGTTLNAQISFANPTNFAFKAYGYLT